MVQDPPDSSPPPGHAVVLGAGVPPQAGHTALSGLFPTQNFDADLQAALDAIPSSSTPRHNSTSIARGRAWGEHVALQIPRVARRHGPNPPPAMPFTGSNGVGEWRPTPPRLFADGREKHGDKLSRSSSSRQMVLPAARGPPALTSARYAADFNEVKRLGEATSATRTADQTQSARFWAGTASFWNRAATAARRPAHNTLSENVRFSPC